MCRGPLSVVTINRLRRMIAFVVPKLTSSRARLRTCGCGRLFDRRGRLALLRPAKHERREAEFVGRSQGERHAVLGRPVFRLADRPRRCSAASPGRPAAAASRFQTPSAAVSFVGVVSSSSCRELALKPGVR